MNVCNKFCSQFYIFAWWWSSYMFHILWSILGIDLLVGLLHSFTKIRIQIGFLVHHTLPSSTNNPPFYWTPVLYLLNHHFCVATTHDTSIICREFLRALVAKRGEVVRLPQILPVFVCTNITGGCLKTRKLKNVSPWHNSMRWNKAWRSKKNYHMTFKKLSLN
jgi:hypothetical protein